MKYDKNQYYYSPSKNYPWFIKSDKPNDAIEMTLEMEEVYEAGINKGLVIQPNANKDGFIMVDPNTLLTPEQRAQQAKANLIQQAKSLIDNTDAFEASTFQSKYLTDEQITQFETWRHTLYDVVYGDSSTIQPTPDFITNFLKA